MSDRWGAYSRRDLTLEPLSEGMLSGLTFAAKDVFAVKGHVSGAGNPDWERTHEAADRHAAAIELLLASGARLDGMTHTDELMFSLNGENFHYGTPVNPKAPDRIPGGSSSGSAVVVAAGLADFAIGTDTGGSVRIPSSYCGIYGFRPTHGRVAIEGVIPLSVTFDTVGWMAGSAKLLKRAGEPLLGPAGDEGAAFGRLIVAEDAMAAADPETREALEPFVEQIASAFASRESATVAPEGLAEWMRMFRVVQGLDIWREHGEWIERTKPRFGPGIAERFAWTSTLDPEAGRAERRAVSDIRKRLGDFLGEDGVLVIPTAPGPALLRNMQGDRLEERRSRTMQLSCIAGIGGLPQITLPWAEVGGCPVGLSLVAGPGQDRKLLNWAADWEERLGPGRTAT